MTSTSECHLTPQIRHTTNARLAISGFGFLFVYPTCCLNQGFSESDPRLGLFP